MTQKTAVIVGASSGIGGAAARRLLQQGWRVFGTYHKDTASLSELETQYRTELFRTYPLDVTHEGSVATTLKTIREQCGVVDAIVYLPTAPVKPKPLFHVHWQDIQQHFDVGVKGLFSLFTVLQDQIEEKKPVRFVVVLTESCISTPPLAVTPYVVGKHALLGLAKSMGREIARFGSTVNMVSPGMVETDLLGSLPPSFIDDTRKKNPMGRIATPDDVAGVIVFLLSEEAAYLNGAHITVNGGNVML